MLQQFVKYEEIHQNFLWLWHVHDVGIAEGSGFIRFSSFIGMHGFMTSKTNLMKQVLDKTVHRWEKCNKAGCLQYKGKHLETIQQSRLFAV